MKRNQLQSPETKLFGAQPELLRPEEAAELLRISVKTIYDWHYRSRLRGIPKGLFLKINRQLYIRTCVLSDWILAQNQ